MERNDAKIHLMEDLYDSSIPELIRVNKQAQSEAAIMLRENNPNACEYLELELIPGFISDGQNGIIVNARDQRMIAEEVLNGLHEAWHGSEAYEYPMTETFTKNYWEFLEDDFTTWTVIEHHDSNPAPNKPALTAYIVQGTRRPEAFQKLKDQNEESRQLKSRKISDETPEQTESPTDSSRTQRAAKSIGKWLKQQTNLPPRPGRFE